MAEVQLLVGGVVVLQALGVQLVLRVDFYSELDNVLTFDISHGTHTHTHKLTHTLLCLFKTRKFHGH